MAEVEVEAGVLAEEQEPSYVLGPDPNHHANRDNAERDVAELEQADEEPEVEGAEEEGE